MSCKDILHNIYLLVFTSSLCLKNPDRLIDKSKAESEIFLGSIYTSGHIASTVWPPKRFGDDMTKRPDMRYYHLSKQERLYDTADQELAYTAV